MPHAKGEKHPLAYLLVYGFATVSLTCSLLAAWITYRVIFKSIFASLGAFGLVAHRFFKIAGGIKGLNRAVGDGKLSVDYGLLANTKEKPPGTVRLVIISDTHNENPETLPGGDILVHCGDFTLKGSSAEVNNFCDWLEKQPHKHKLVIAGNHDMGLEFLSTENAKAAHARLAKTCILLENSGASIEGLKFWGSPQTPYISKTRRMGFQDSSDNLAPYWERIPEGTDILVTHGPPLGYGDRVLFGKHVGCPELMKRIKVIRPRYHLFGHIHEAYGTYVSGDGCLFINAAICNTLYNPIHAPLVIDVPVL